MFEKLNLLYDDLCWWEIEDEHLKELLKMQVIQEIGISSDLFLIKNNLVAIAKSDRQDDVLFSDGENYYVVHLTYNTNNSSKYLRYKMLKQNELMDYMEWYYNNV